MKLIQTIREMWKHPIGKIFFILFSLLIIFIGLILVVSTAYQELIREPQSPEDYHMAPQPIGKYEWKSRNLPVTMIGFAFIIFGLGFLTVGILGK